MDAPDRGAAGPHLSREEVRAVDRVAIEELGVPGVVLMENAGLGATEVALEMLGERTGPVVVLCGGGNNGGDGYVVARQLALRGREVLVFATVPAEGLSGDALVNRGIVERMELPLAPLENEEQLADALEALAGASLVVDALLGTGFRGDVREPLASALRALDAGCRERGVPVLALDLPSGLDCDSGQASNAVLRATRTVTFVARKRGFAAAGADAFTGPVTVVPIGVGLEHVERARRRAAGAVRDEPGSS